MYLEKTKIHRMAFVSREHACTKNILCHIHLEPVKTHTHINELQYFKPE